jgi:phosphopantetheinyl transferase (holo-ACP synthase)
MTSDISKEIEQFQQSSVKNCQTAKFTRSKQLDTEHEFITHYKKNQQWHIFLSLSDCKQTMVLYTS